MIVAMMTMLRTFTDDCWESGILISGYFAIYSDASVRDTTPTIAFDHKTKDIYWICR